MTTPNVEEELKRKWISPLTYDKHVDKKHISVAGEHNVIWIKFFDDEARILVIPLKDVEFIDHIAPVLTFNMKSGTKHSIYVGSEKLSKQLVDLIIDKFIEYLGV